MNGYFFVGGLVGNNEALATIDTSYATGAVSGSMGGKQVGGLVGSNAGALSNSFYDVDQVEINGGHEMTPGGIYDTQYLDWFNHNETLNIANYSTSLPAGTGGYYNVGSLKGFEDLLGFSENNAADNFRLTANISLPAGLFIPYFMGDFDGAGFVISNLSVSVPNDNVGLFGVLPSSATLISNLSVSHGNVSGHNNVGGLVGNNSYGATISNSSFSGSVSGYDDVGGLLGINNGAVTGSRSAGAVSGVYEVGGLVGGNYGATISNSYSSVVVDGVAYVGGLVGFNVGPIVSSFASGNVTTSSSTVGGLVGGNEGSISDSYASGSVSGSNAGGLVGSGYGGSVSNSYASGAVSGSGAVGGLMGTNYSSTVSNTFYNSSANPTLAGMSNAADAPGVVLGLTLAQLQTQANFTSATSANGNVNPGWDFTSTWTLYEGHSDPLLRAFMTPLVVGGGTTIQTYDGAAFSPAISSLNYSIVPDPTLLSGTVRVTGTAQGAVHVGSYTYTPGGLYSTQLGYLISYTNGALSITPAPLTVSDTTVLSKVYDGTTAATLTGGTLAGVLAGDSIALTQLGGYASRHAGTGIAVAASDVLSGANTSDYLLTQPTGLTGAITPAPLSVNGTHVDSKVADGNTAATLTSGSLSGVLTGDSVTLGQAGTFASSHAGTHIAVTANDTLGGPSAGDYSLTEPTGLSASITSPINVPTEPTVPGAPLLVAENVVTQLLSNWPDPPVGLDPQDMNVSPTIERIETSASDSDRKRP